MFNFEFYKYTFKRHKMNDELFQPQEVSIDESRKFFEDIFTHGKSLLLQGEKEKYENNVVYHKKDDIIVLRIHKDTIKTIVESTGIDISGIPDFGERNEKSYPYCYVVIDNRPGKQFIAVQKSNSWRKPNKVQEVLQYSFSRYMEKGALAISIEELVIPLKIWDYCSIVCKDGEDYITRITLNINNQKNNSKSKTTDGSANNLIETIREHLRIVGASDGNLDFKYDNEEDRIAKIEDTIQFIKICAESDYSLSVYLKNSGVYKCAESVVAIFQLRKEIIETLNNNQSSIEEYNALADWLDDSIKKYKEYENYTRFPEGRKRTNRR